MNVSVAQDDLSSYQAVEFYCYDLPLVLRKQARNQQYFHFSNIGFHDLYYIIFPDTWREHGVMQNNIVPEIKEGIILEGKTLTLTNTAIQIRNVPIANEEGAEVCFTPVEVEGDGYEWEGKFSNPLGRVSVREIRRAASGWVSFTIPKGVTWWTVRGRYYLGASAKSLSAQRKAAQQ